MYRWEHKYVKNEMKIPSQISNEFWTEWRFYYLVEYEQRCRGFFEDNKFQHRKIRLSNNVCSSIPNRRVTFRLEMHKPMGIEDYNELDSGNEEEINGIFKPMNKMRHLSE